MLCTDARTEHTYALADPETVRRILQANAASLGGLPVHRVLLPIVPAIEIVVAEGSA